MFIRFILRSAIASIVGLAFVIGSAPFPVHGQHATPASSCSSSPEQNKALVMRWYEQVFNQGTMDVIDELLAEDAVQHNPNQPDGAITGDDAIEAAVRERRLVDFPDAAIEVEDMIAAGDLVMARIAWTATVADELEYMGDLAVPTNGTRADWSSTGLFRLSCGEIAEQWFSSDELRVAQQIGAIPDPMGRSGTPAAGSIPVAGGTPATTCAPTTTADNEVLVRRLYDEVYNGRHLDLVPELHAGNHIHHAPSGLLGEPGDAAQQERLGEWLNDLPDLTMTVEAVVAEGDEVGVRWSAAGTYHGDFEQVGLPGNDRPVAFGGMAIYRLACGEIAESWFEWDALSVYRQLIAPMTAATPVP